MKLYKGFLEINGNLLCMCKSNNFKYIDKKIRGMCKMLNCKGIVCCFGGFKWYGK